MGFEPGTEQATQFVSKVRLTDKSAGIKDQPHTISMNHPLDHRGYTFYQSNYIRVRDPHTRQVTGSFSRSSRSPPTPAGRSSTPVACWSFWARSCSSTCGRGSSPTAASESASAPSPSEETKAKLRTDRRTRSRVRRPLSRESSHDSSTRETMRDEPQETRR